MCMKESNGSSLQVASAHSHEAVIQLLLEKDMDANMHGGHYSSMLQMVSVSGHKAVIWLLLEKDMDINAQGVDDSSSATASLRLAAGHQVS